MTETRNASPDTLGGGWIDHDGGPNPVPGRRVEWKSRAFTGTGEADHLGWGRDHLMPIRAYRVVEASSDRPVGIGKADETITPPINDRGEGETNQQADRLLQPMSVEMVARYMAGGAAMALDLKSPCTGHGGWASANWRKFVDQSERLMTAMQVAAPSPKGKTLTQDDIEQIIYEAFGLGQDSEAANEAARKIFALSNPAQALPDGEVS